jgi:hypothetical protein
MVPPTVKVGVPVVVQVIETEVTLAEATVPEALATVQSWAGFDGCVDTVTA